MTFEEIENDLNKLSLIRFKKKYKFNDFKEVIKFALIGEKNTQTYYSKNGTKQCEENKMRGIADLYRLSKNYFPDVKLKDVYEITNKLFCYQGECATTHQSVYEGTRDEHKIGPYNYSSIRLSNFYTKVIPTN